MLSKPRAGEDRAGYNWFCFALSPAAGGSGEVGSGARRGRGEGGVRAGSTFRQIENNEKCCANSLPAHPHPLQLQFYTFSLPNSQESPGIKV